MTALLVSLVLMDIGITLRSPAQSSPSSGAAKSRETFANSLGMKFVRVEPGRFTGQERGAGWEKVKILDRTSAEAWLDSTTQTDWAKCQCMR